MRHEADPWNIDGDKIDGDEPGTTAAPLRPMVLGETGVAATAAGGHDTTAGRSEPRFASVPPGDATRRGRGAHRLRRRRAWWPTVLAHRHGRRRELLGALILLACVPLVLWLVLAPKSSPPASPDELFPMVSAAPDTSSPVLLPTEPALPSASDTPLRASSSNPPFVPAAATPASSRKAPPNPVPSPTPPPPLAWYVAVQGPGCPGGGYSEHGAYRDGRAGWYWLDAGGWHGDGCGGAMTAVPMSGEANWDDPTAWVRWSFDIRPVVHGTCAISVYVPKTGDWRDAAGSPAYYDVAAGSSGPRIGTFTVDQIHAQGTWVTAGSFNVSAGAAVVTLHTRGIDWNKYGPTYAHLAAAQVKVSCTATV